MIHFHAQPAFDLDPAAQKAADEHARANSITVEQAIAQQEHDDHAHMVVAAWGVGLVFVLVMAFLQYRWWKQQREMD